jgi:hypothetical protein
LPTRYDAPLSITTTPAVVTTNPVVAFIASFA